MGKEICYLYLLDSLFVTRQNDVCRIHKTWHEDMSSGICLHVVVGVVL
jgi:hypothetical protein